MARTASETERLVRAHNEIWNERDYSKIPDVVSESYVEYNPVVPEGELRGRDAMEEWLRTVTAAFPDIRADILDLLVDDGTAMAELEFTMTHEGEFLGIEPTGREVAFRGMAKFTIEDGAVTELRNHFDVQEVFEQLGVADRPTDREHPPRATTDEENERLALEHFDRVWHRGEFDTELLADDYRVHTSLGERETHTLEEYRTFVGRSREAIPDLRKEPDDVFATDGRAAIRYTMTGTQEGEFDGIPATGGEIEIDAIDVFRIENGEIAEEWIVADFLRAMKQLGVVD